MPKYKQKPVVIDAVQWDGELDTQLIIESWIGAGIGPDHGRDGVPIAIQRNDGVRRTSCAVMGDWILCGTRGEVWQLPDDLFRVLYEPVLPADKESLHTT